MTYKFQASPRRKLSVGLGLVVTAALTIIPSAALGAGSGGLGTGGTGTGTTAPTTGQTTAGPKAKLKDGYAIPPANAPRKVVRAIEAANEIVKGKPYCMGGGHASRRDTCYACSGSVSYALTGAGLLDSTLPTGSFMDWAPARHLDDRRRRTRVEHRDALRARLRGSASERLLGA